MAIEARRQGPARGRALDIVITSDGRATCNDGSEETIPSDLLIDARELERDLGDLAEEGATFEPAPARAASTSCGSRTGTVRWTEGDRGLPRELPRDAAAGAAARPPALPFLKGVRPL